MNILIRLAFSICSSSSLCASCLFSKFVAVGGKHRTGKARYVAAQVWCYIRSLIKLQVKCSEMSLTFTFSTCVCKGRFTWRWRCALHCPVQEVQGENSCMYLLHFLPLCTYCKGWRRRLSPHRIPSYIMPQVNALMLPITFPFSARARVIYRGEVTT